MKPRYETKSWLFIYLLYVLKSWQTMIQFQDEGIGDSDGVPNQNGVLGSSMPQESSVNQSGM